MLIEKLTPYTIWIRKTINHLHPKTLPLAGTESAMMPTFIHQIAHNAPYTYSHFYSTRFIFTFIYLTKSSSDSTYRPATTETHSILQILSQAYVC